MNRRINKKAIVAKKLVGLRKVQKNVGERSKVEWKMDVQVSFRH